MDIDDEEEENTKHCTNCKRSIKTDVYEMHTLHCHRKIKLCPVCKEPVPKEQMDEHHEDNHTETSCGLCGQKVMKDQLEDHQTNECRERKMECKYCQLEVKAVDFMEHTAACGSRTDVCDKCLTRLMLKDMDDHRCGEPPPFHYNQYYTPPKPHPSGTRRAVRVDVDEIEQAQNIESHGKETGADDVSDQLKRDEEMAAELQAQYTKEVPHHHAGSPHPLLPHPLSPNSILIQNTHYSPTTSPRDRFLHETADNLLTEQLEFEARTGTRGQSTMALYNLAVNEEKKRNGGSPSSPIVLNGEEEEGGREREEEEEEEERRREQMKKDEEMARQLQEEEEEETQRLLARFGQAAPHRNSPSPPPLLNTGGLREGTGERRENEEGGVLIPCDVCRELIPFDDYQRHTNERHSRVVGYVQNITRPPPPQRYSSPEHMLHRETASPSPPNNSPKAENGDINCSYCHFKYSPDVIIYHETICDMNPDRGLSKRQLQSSKVNGTNIGGESPLSPVRQLEDLTRSTDDSDEDNVIPCQFCDQLFPLSEIERHQKTCPTRFNTPFLERDRGRARNYDIFGSNVSDEHKTRTSFNSAPIASSATKKTSFTPSNYGGASVVSYTSTKQKMSLVSDQPRRPSLENNQLTESKYNRSSSTSGAVGGGSYGRERETRENGRGRGLGTRGGTRGGRGTGGGMRGGTRGTGGGMRGGTRGTGGGMRGGTRGTGGGMRGGTRGTGGGMRGGTRGERGGGRGGSSGSGGSALFIDLTEDNANKRDNGEYGLIIEGSTDHKDEDEMEVDFSYTQSDGSSRGYQGDSFTKRRK